MKQKGHKYGFFMCKFEFLFCYNTILYKINEFFNTKNICYYKTCNSSNWEKMDIIMNHLWNMEEYIIGELEKVLDELNGTVSSIKTEQFECQGCYPCKAFIQPHEKHFGN